MLVMNKVEIITVSELSPLLNELDVLKSKVELFGENCQPLFQGKRYLTDSAVCRRLNICKRTLATYRSNGALGYYNLPGKILYSDTDVEDFLQRHYLPPFR